MLPDDIPVLIEIYRASIEELTDDDYSPEQQQAWLATADDEDAFAARLTAELVLVATEHGSPVAFAALKGADELDLLFVHPAAARQGAATMLVDALEKLAGGRGTATLTVDASDTARAFFDARGYVAQRRNTVLLGNEWLSNTTMTKRLEKPAGTGAMPATGGRNHDH
jgi:putative acetyltransferase